MYGFRCIRLEVTHVKIFTEKGKGNGKGRSKGRRVSVNGVRVRVTLEE